MGVDGGGVVRGGEMIGMDGCDVDVWRTSC